MEGQLIAALRGTLEPNIETIRAAEHRLKHELHEDPSTGQALLNVIFTPATGSIESTSGSSSGGGGGVELAVRQAAAVNLNAWIKERWSAYFDDFRGFGQGREALPLELKPPIREALLHGLVLEDSKLRGPMSKALVNVAACDWPDEFPDLVPRIKSLLQGGGASNPGVSGQGLIAQQGALAFLDDWINRDIDEVGLMTVTRELLPDLERILGQADVYPAAVRCHCISIFNQLLETLLMVRETFVEASKAVADDVLPKWLTALEALVASDPTPFVKQNFDQSAGEEAALRVQAWSVLRTACHFTSHFKPRAESLVQLALKTLEALMTPVERFHISPAEDQEDLDEAAPSDALFFSTPSDLARSILDFLGVSVDFLLFASKKDRAGTSVEGLARHVISLLRAYSQVTKSDEEEWYDNVSAFVAAAEDETMGALASSTRARCLDIVAEMLSRRQTQTMNALDEAMREGHLRGQAKRKEGIAAWWKEEEAGLALIGGVAEDIVDHLQEGGQSTSFNLETIFAQSVLPHIHPESPPFLYGRCFVFASQFAPVLPQDLAKQFLDAAVNVIEDESTSSEGLVIVKLSAVRCLKNFHRHLSEDVVRPYTGRILSRLGPLLSNASEDTLILIVETLQAVAMQSEGDLVDPIAAGVPPQVYGEIVAESIKAWAKEAKDRMLQSVVEDLVEAFAAQKTESIASDVISRVVPMLAHLLSPEILAQSSAGGGVLVEGSLEFADALARGAKAEVLARSVLIEGYFPPLFAALEANDDREAFTNGAKFLSQVIAKVPKQVFDWRDVSGQGATSHILLLVSKMISMQDSAESGGLAVGDLLTTMLRKAPMQLQDSLPSLCTALVDRLATAQSSSLNQSLIIPLAFLMKDYAATVIALLQQHMVVSRSESGLDVLAKQWIDHAETIQGFWNQRVSTLGLVALLQARVAALDQVVVNGDLIPDDSNIIRTRSRAKATPHRYTQVPLPAKALKLLINDYRTAQTGPPSSSSNQIPGQRAPTPDTDDGNDEWDDDEPIDGGLRKDEQFLSDMLGEDLEGGLEDLIAQHDEEVYRDDAIYNMNLKAYLEDFFRHEASQSDAGARIAAYLTSDEVELLKRAIS